MTETYSHAEVSTYPEAVAAAASMWRATGRRVTVRSAYADGRMQVHRPWHTIDASGEWTDTNTNGGVKARGRHIRESLDDLAEAIFEAEECAADLEAQHQAECAGYGDSWPGAAIQVAEAWERVRAMKAEYAAASTAEPELMPRADPADDIPF